MPRAIRIHEAGGAEVMRFEDVEVGAPLAGEVQVRLAACAICHSDVHLLDGDWGDVARPLVPGHEIVGRVTGFAMLIAELSTDASATPSQGLATP